MDAHITGILIANNYLMKCKSESSNVELARKLLSLKVKEALAIKSKQTSSTKS